MAFFPIYYKVKRLSDEGIFTKGCRAGATAAAGPILTVKCNAIIVTENHVLLIIGNHIRENA